MKRNLKRSWFIVFALLVAGVALLLGCASRFKTDAFACEEVRAAFDIGSGTTKMVVARVDCREDTVLQVLAPAPGAKLECKVEYAKNIVEASDGRKVFSDRVISQGLDCIEELKASALSHGAEVFSAVATSAFRSVDRAHACDVLGRIHRETGIRAVVIEQEQEARIGFLAAAVKLDVSKERLVVWDIGLGSMQISCWDPKEGSVTGYRGEFANEAMHRFIIETLQGRAYRPTTSPNPILRPGFAVHRPNDLSRAIQKAEAVAGRDVSPGLRDRLRGHRNEVIGIGGVHFYSNCEVMRRFSKNGCSFTREELLAQAYRYTHLTDQELVEHGLSQSIEFAPFRISGAALTVGFMNALGIDAVRAIKVDMADGILNDPAFWVRGGGEQGCR